MFLHQIEGVEFIYDSHGQTFLSTLYIHRISSHFRFALSFRLLHRRPLTDETRALSSKSFIADETGLDRLSLEEGFTILNFKRQHPRKSQSPGIPPGEMSSPINAENNYQNVRLGSNQLAI